MAEIRDYSNNPDPQTSARWPEGMAMASVNDTGRVDEGILGRWEKDIDGSLVSAGIATAYTVTPNRDLVTGQVTPLYDGLEITFIPHVDSGESPTLNVQSTGAKSLVNQDGDALRIGNLKQNYPVKARYNATLDAYVATGLVGLNRVPWNEPAAGQVNTTGSAPLATGTDAQRPASPSTGDIRFNTDDDDPEVYKGSSSSWESLATGRSEYPPNHLDGLTISNGTTVGTDYNVSTGSARSDDDQANIDLTAAITNKKLNTGFAEGSNQGGLDTGTIAPSTKYYVFVIGKDDGTADILFSLSQTAPTLPTGFTVQRRIGYAVTNASSVGDGRVGQVLNTLEETESINFTTARATYDIFWTDDWSKVVIQASGVLPVSNQQAFNVRLSADGSTFDSGASDYVFRTTITGTNVGSLGGSSSNNIQVTNGGANGVGNAAISGLAGEFEVLIPGDSTSRTALRYGNSYFNSASTFLFADGLGQRQANAIVNGIRFFFASGDIAEGAFVVRFMR